MDFWRNLQKVVSTKSRSLLSLTLTVYNRFSHLSPHATLSNESPLSLADPLNGDQWSSKTRVGVEPESEWSVHLQGWPGEIEIIFACPVNPHQVVAR